MTDQLPTRVSPGEISVFLDQLRAIGPDAPLAERIEFFERKANLLSRVAENLGTPEAHEVAADAWTYLAHLAHHAHAQPGTEGH